MKKIIISFFTVLVLSGFQILCAQETALDVSEVQNENEILEQAKNVIYLELGGASVFFTLNYERRFTDNLSVRVGGGYFSLGNMTSVPVGINYQFETGAWRLETSMGISYLYLEPIMPVIFVSEEDHEQEKISTVNYTPGIGLRYQPSRFESRDLFFRVAITPHIKYNLKRVAPLAGISFGVAF